MSSRPDLVLLLITRCLYQGVQLSQVCLTVIFLLNWVIDNWTEHVCKFILVFLLFLFLMCNFVVVAATKLYSKNNNNNKKIKLLIIEQKMYVDWSFCSCCFCFSCVILMLLQQQNYTVTTTRTTAAIRSLYIKVLVNFQELIKTE